MKKRLFVLLILVGFINTISAQDFSNKGKEFWIAYSSHIDAKLSVMGIYITSDKSANGNIYVNGTNIPFTVTPNQITRKFIGSSAGNDGSNNYVYLDIQDGIKTDAAIKITSDVPVVVYSHIIRSARSAASLILPTPVLGTEYIIPSYPSVSTSGGGSEQGGIGLLSVVATQPNTVIEINPTIASRNGLRSGGNPFQITLVNPGDIYQLHGGSLLDLSGSTVKSVSSATGGCKPIAVFSASTWSAFDCAGASGGDNLYQQLFPTRSWGRQFITAPFKNRPSDIYRVFVIDPTTQVILTDGGVPQIMGGAQYNATGKFYQYKTGNPVYISADKPISVVQYITSQTCKTGCTTGGANTLCYSDPEMVILNPIEQTLKEITFFSAHKNFVPTGQSNVDLHFVNIIINKNFKSSLKVDGGSIPTSFFVDIPGTNYAYLQEDLTVSSATNPVHKVTADTGFSAIVYGFGNVESYGYNGGTNIVDLYQYVTLQNQHATVNFPATCKNTPFKFSITLPYQPLKLNWDFNNAANLSPSTPIINNNPIYDSTFIKDGKNLYVYKLSSNYLFSQIGTYNIKVLVNNPTTDGCSGDQEIDYQVEVFNPPIASFTINSNGCTSSALTFNDQSQTSGRNLIRWRWDFGDGTIDSIKNPSKLYTSGGTFPIKYTITTDVGCISDTTKNVVLTPPPIAKFGIKDSLCVNSLITVSDSSTFTAPSSIAKWYWNYGNGIKDTLLSSSNPIVAYADTGTFTITLMVETNSGCRSNLFSKQIKIRSNPVVDFTMPNIICLPVGLASFGNNSSINDGTTSSLIYKWEFGDGKTSNLKNPATNYSALGPFNVKLTVSSLFGCTQNDTKVLNTIYPQPKSIFNITNEVCLRDTTSYFDMSDGKGSAVIKWRWSFGDGFTDTIQNPKHLYNTVGLDTVKLFVYTDKGCVSDTTFKTTVVNPLPTAGFSFSNPICEKRPIKFNDTSKANVGTLIQWGWNMGNGHSYTFNSLPNPFNEVYDTTGIYFVKLRVVNSKGCKGDSTLPIQIKSNPLPHIGFVLPDVCLDDAFAQFTDTSKISDGSQNLFNYSWNFGDINATPPLNANTSNIKNPIHKYSDTGIYNVKLFIASNNFCADSITKSFTVNGSTPKANFTVLSSSNLCSNDSVKIQNSSTVDFGKITKLEIYWDTVNNPTLKTTDNNPLFNKIYSTKYLNFQQPSSKIYYIKVFAYSGISCVNTKTIQINLNQSPRVQFINIKGICNDTTPRLISEATETGGVPGIGIFTGVGITNNITGLFNPQSVIPGIFTIKYTYTSTNFACIDSASKTITVWRSPLAKFGFGFPACEKNNLLFFDSSLTSVGTIIKWNWDFGNGTIINRVSPLPFTYQYNNANNYFATLKVTTDSGCFNSKTLPVKINFLPKVKFGLPSICLPNGNGTFLDSSTIGDNSEALFAYLWNFGDVSNPTPSVLQNPTFKYFDTIPKNVKLIITSKDGCIDSLTKVLTTIYPQPKAKFILTPDTIICYGSTIKFFDRSNGKSSPPNKWNWNFGLGATSTAKNPIQLYTDSGTLTATLFIYNEQNCVSDTAKQNITIYPYPIIKLPASLTFLKGGLLTIKPLYYYGSNLTFKWTPKYNIISDTVLLAQVFPDDDKRYKLTVTSEGYCSDTASVQVVILREPVIPNSFSPNADGINDYWVIEHLGSYPGCSVQVFDRYGRLLFTSIGYGKNWDGKMNGAILPTGTYYYIVDPKNGRQKLSGSITIFK